MLTESAAVTRPLRERDRAEFEGQPVVSVVITTFNTASSLPQTLESVLDQCARFAVEIVIYDDFSQDGTVEVAREYQQRYPHIIRFFEREQHASMQRNYYDAFEQARGRYIAWLDSDDCWTDPVKLEVQVEALDADPSVAMCGHYVRWVLRDPEFKVEVERYPRIAPGRYGLEDILRKNFMPSPSIMFRNGLHRQLPPCYFEIRLLGDWPVNVVAAQQGAILMLDHTMADYTLNPKGTFWSGGSRFWYESDILFYNYVELFIPASFHRLARSEKGRRYESLAYLLRKQGDFAGSRRAAIQAFRAPLWRDQVGSKSKALLAAVVRELQWRLTGRRRAA